MRMTNPAAWFASAAHFLQLREQHAQLCQGARENASRLGEVGSDPSRAQMNIYRNIANAADMRAKMMKLAEDMGEAVPDLSTAPAELPDVPSDMPSADQARYGELLFWETEVPARTQPIVDRLAGLVGSS